MGLVIFGPCKQNRNNNQIYRQHFKKNINIIKSNDDKFSVIDQFLQHDLLAIDSYYR